MQKLNILLIIIAAILFSSCVVTEEHPRNEDAVSAIKAVIQNERQFYCGEDGSLLYLKDFNSSNYLYLTDDAQLIYTKGNEAIGEYSFDKVCVQDIDNDGLPEILIITEPVGDIFIFHYENDAVYEFTFPYRGMLNLKQDGSFASSGASSNYYIGMLKFDGSTCSYEELCVFDETDANNVQFRINGKNSTRSDVEIYINNFDEKEDALWIDWESWND